MIKYLLTYLIRGNTDFAEIREKAIKLNEAGSNGIILTNVSLVVNHRTKSKDSTIIKRVIENLALTLILFTLALKKLLCFPFLAYCSNL